MTPDKVIIPHHLQAGANIAVISPASPPREERLTRGVHYLEQRGFKVVQGEHVLDRYRYLSGKGPGQISDLLAAFADPDVDGIICSRGGYGTPRYLHQLDYDLIRNNAKPFVGYSDITALQCALLTRAGMASFSGPMAAVEMGTEDGFHPYSEDCEWRLLTQTLSGQVLRNPETEPWQVLKEGRGEGRLIGGCLSLFNNLMGTPFLPDFHGNLLVLEDIGENMQHIDRMLNQFKHAGFFAEGGIQGLLLGQFLDITPEEEDFTLPELVRDILGPVDFPIISGLAYGHGRIKMTIPLGAQARVDTASGGIELL